VNGEDRVGQHEQRARALSGDRYEGAVELIGTSRGAANLLITPLSLILLGFAWVS
jgi:hypothetical protein